MILLAIDGVYLAEPRAITALEFLPASRADIAVKCHFSAEPIQVIDPDSEAVVMRIETFPSEAQHSTLDLSQWSWQRPFYLQDLRLVQVDRRWRIRVDLHMPIINRATVCSRNALCVSHVLIQYRGGNRSYALHESLLGSVEEWFVTA